MGVSLMDEIFFNEEIRITVCLLQFILLDGILIIRIFAQINFYTMQQI